MHYQDLSKTRKEKIPCFFFIPETKIGPGHSPKMFRQLGWFDTRLFYTDMTLLLRYKRVVQKGLFFNLD